MTVGFDQDQLVGSGKREKRRHERQPQSLDTAVRVGRWPFGRSYRAKIRDISEVGACLEFAEDGPKLDDDSISVRWKVPPEMARTEIPVDCDMAGTARNTGRRRCGVRFDKLISESVAESCAWKIRLTAACSVAALVGLVALLKARNVESFWYEPAFQIYSLAAAGYVLSRIWLSTCYREPRDQGSLPKTSIIISVKNEERHITSTVEGVFLSRYPAELYELIVIDDGSTDGTWDVLCRLRELHPRLRIFRFVKNRGKRHGMALGAREAGGDILVFLDSDSRPERDALYRLVQPFVDPKVGAVAGHTLVIVEDDNFISKMEAVRYFVSQRVVKAAESLFHSVTCCPGPFSAYRREAMMRVIFEWENQTFLGAPATFGDDRSLTNFILRDYRVVYHAGARVATYVPDTWPVFFRQQLRWKKSFVRETTIAVRHMHRRGPAAAVAYYISIAIAAFSPLVAVRALIIQPLSTGSPTFIPYLAGLMLVYLIFGLIYRFHTRESRWCHGLAFALLYVFFLSFQNYYAILTVRQNHWGTR